MATYQKRGTAWRASVARRGQRLTSTHDTRAQAEAWAIETEARIMAGQVIAATPATRAGQTVADLMARYAREVSPHKGGARWECTRLRTWPETHALFAGPVAALTAPALATWRDERLRTVTGATVNRELNLLSAVCNRAIREWHGAGSCRSTRCGRSSGLQQRRRGPVWLQR